MLSRVVALGALAGFVLVLALLFLRDDGRTLHARFESAAQVVKGGSAKIAGRPVGSIADIDVSDDGLARVEIELDPGIVLREGTRAAIRAVGQAGIANRFVELYPGPRRAPELPDGATLGTTHTASMVNVDALLDSFGPSQRAAMRELIANGESIYAGSGARSFNRMLVRLSPALRRLDGLWSDLASDRVALTGLIDRAAEAADAVASRRADLVSAVGHTATAMGAIAGERRALAGTLSKAPLVLTRARRTLTTAENAVRALRPALRATPRASAALRDVLGGTATALPRAEPVVAELNSQLPSLRAALEALPPLRVPGLRALRSTRRTMAAAREILRGVRFYGSDFVIGALASVGGTANGSYDARGHYAKVNFVESPQSLPGGRLSRLLNTRALVPGLLDVRTKVYRRCPGGNVPPAPDGSNPWLLSKEICSTAHNTPASVNEP